MGEGNGNSGYSAPYYNATYDVTIIDDLNDDGDNNNRTVAGQNLIQAFSTLPQVNALGKHLDGANYSFADGHVKWLKKEKITNSAISAGSATFSMQ
jgi:prepilin-type processing-associated H-X9-DG protein